MNVSCETEWKSFDFIDLPEDKSFIYLIYNEDNRIIYIGQTRSFILRMATHLMQKKDAKKIKYFEVSSLIVNELENEMILKYKPKYNRISRILKKKEKPESFKNLKEYLNFHDISVQKFARKISLKREFTRDIVVGIIKPSPKLAKIIQQATNGEVKAEDLLKGE